MTTAIPSRTYAKNRDDPPIVPILCGEAAETVARGGDRRGWHVSCTFALTLSPVH